MSAFRMSPDQTLAGKKKGKHCVSKKTGKKVNCARQRAGRKGARARNR